MQYRETGRLLMRFTELDNGTLSAVRTRRKYQLYETWSRSSEAGKYPAELFARYGAGTQEPNWRLFHDCPRQGSGRVMSRRLPDLLAQALDLTTAMRERIWLIAPRTCSCHG